MALNNRPSRRRLWSAIALVVVLGVAAGCTGEGSHQPEPSGSATPRASASAPACAPRIVESGFSHNGAYFTYGYIAENPCDQAAVRNQVDMQPLTASGAPVGEKLDGLGNLPVILPGQRLGVSGSFQLSPGADTVASLAFEIPHNELLPLSAFAAWPKSVTARNVSYGSAGTGGYVPMKFEIVTDPPNTPMCHPVAHIIARDKQGRIAYGREVEVKSPQISLDVPFPPTADLAKTEIYVAQGMYVIGIGQDAAIACRSGT